MMQVFHDGKPRCRLLSMLPAGVGAVECRLASVDDAGHIAFTRREVKTLDAPGLELLGDHDRGRIRSALLALNRENACAD